MEVVILIRIKLQIANLCIMYVMLISREFFMAKAPFYSHEVTK